MCKIIKYLKKNKNIINKRVINVILNFVNDKQIKTKKIKNPTIKKKQKE